MTGPINYHGTIAPAFTGHVDIAADALLADTFIRARHNPHLGWCFEDEADAVTAHIVAHREILHVHPSGYFTLGTTLIAFTADEWASMTDALQAFGADA